MAEDLRPVLAEAGGRYALLVGSFFLVAVLEVIGVGLLPVFIASLNEPRALLGRAGLGNAPLLAPLDDVQIVTALGLVLCFFFLAKNLLLGGVAYFQARFVAARQAQLSTRLLAVYLSQPYTFHLQRNSAELIRNTTSLTFNVLGGVVIPGCTLITESLVLALLGMVLLAVNPVVTVIAAFVIGGAALLFYRGFRTRLHALGKRQQSEGTEIHKWVAQALGGIKEAIILGRQDYFIERYARHIAVFSRSNIAMQTVGVLPRLFLEALLVCGLALVVVVLVNSGTALTAVFATLALFGIAALRLLPSTTRIVGALTSIKFHQSSIDTVARDLAQRPARRGAPGKAPRLEFGAAIELRGLGYTYPGAGTPALRDVSLRIPRGAVAAFVGRSGAGKSTLVDILIGLHPPTQGVVLIDGRDLTDNVEGWQQNIGYVPQTIFLTDDSLRRNVAFGLSDEQIDDAGVWRALQAAQLDEFVRTLPAGLDTAVGERGSRLSGGQRQRIGIARALYRDPQLLVLDEPTAALDRPTAEEVSAVLMSLTGHKTILLIAHQLATVRLCRHVFLLRDGTLAAAGSFDELAAEHAGFQALVE
jgi:ATP-binding cassette, subfamily B, bacterial PglK